MAAMEYLDIAQFITALLFVTVLIYGIGWVAKRSGIEKRIMLKQSPKGRLCVVDSVMVDPRTRMVIVQCDEAEHLLLIGQEGSLVVKQDIGK